MEKYLFKSNIASFLHVFPQRLDKVPSTQKKWTTQRQLAAITYIYCFEKKRAGDRKILI